MPKTALKRILHVDDQPDIRGIVKLSLGKVGGFTVQSCGSGQAALEAAPGFEPDLLLLDMSMPDMDGVELLARFRTAGIHAPAVFFTARANAEDLARYLAAGAIGTVAKPFDPLKLGRQISEIWAQNDGPRASAPESSAPTRTPSPAPEPAAAAPPPGIAEPDEPVIIAEEIVPAPTARPTADPAAEAQPEFEPALASAAEPQPAAAAAVAVAPLEVPSVSADDDLIGSSTLASEGFQMIAARRAGKPSADPATQIVLVIDDDVPTAELAARVLRRAGFQVMVVTNPRDAARQMLKLGAPALVLLDIEMPGLSGFDFLATMRANKHLKDTPVVLFTAHSERRDIVRGLLAGADGFIAKPIKGSALVNAVKTVLSA